MSNFHDFLVERAMFPLPVPDETKFTGHIEIHAADVERLDAKWKATHAVRDNTVNTLVLKLCHALQDILEDMELSAVAEIISSGFFHHNWKSIGSVEGLTLDGW